jgi:SPP1 family predicted phage head-tail adaptor
MELLDVGKLDRRIEIWGYTEAENDRGEVIDTFTKEATTWGMIFSSSLRGAAGLEEGFEGAKETAFEDNFFLIRFRTIDEKKRLKFAGDFYDIKGIQRMDFRGRDRYLKIKARRVE